MTDNKDKADHCRNEADKELSKENPNLDVAREWRELAKDYDRAAEKDHGP